MCEKEREREKEVSVIFLRDVFDEENERVCHRIQPEGVSSNKLHLIKYL